MRTNHQLARLQTRSLGSIAVFGNSAEGGIFSKINTFGGVPKAIKARRASATRASSLVSRGDSLSDNYITPGVTSPSQSNNSSQSFTVPAGYDLTDADNPLTGGESDSSLVGKPALTMEQWDSGNPLPRSTSEKEGRIAAYKAYQTAWRAANATSSNLGAGPLAYFGSNPAMTRREGGIMTSITTFGDAGDDPEHSHTTQYLAGSGGTILLLAAGYFALKWTRRV